ncbi:MAG: AAA family ATPase [Xanthobacteraceae bacterium]
MTEPDLMTRRSDAAPPFFVLTGGPGAGKTTLIEALARAGVTTVAEAGRAVIRDEETRGGRALPWLNPLAFAGAMLARDVANYEAMRGAAAPVVFDRGIPDIAGYLRLEGLDPPQALRAAMRRHRYRPCVFICPPWREIYTADSERWQSFDVARRTYRAMVEVYGELGYELVEVPRAPVEARLRFIRDRIG